MLDKLKFNNLVISNKNGIQQARIQTINKLVHKIRKLKTLLEKHPDNTKCKERIRKSTETLEILKKLKRVDIMKKELLLDKPAVAVITNGLSTPEEMAVALLNMNKVMQGLIKRFKLELNLDEVTSDEWKQALMENSKRRQKIERTEEKRRKRLEMKQQKALGRKRQEWLEENQNNMNNNENPEVADAEELNVSATGKWKVEELEYENGVGKENAKDQNNTILTKKRPLEEKPSNMKANKVNNKKLKRDKELGKKSYSVEENSEREDEIVSDNEITDFNLSKTKDDHVPEEEPEQEEDLVVDPFFITETGENYLSTAVVKTNQNDKQEDNDDKRDLHMIKLNNSDKKPVDFREKRQQNRHNQRDNRPTNKNNEKGRGTQNHWNNKQNNDRDKFSQNKFKDKKQVAQDFRNKNVQNTKEEDKLHPSWAAKQKLKPVITGFQGKKIKFGDDDEGNNNNNGQQDISKQSPKKIVSSKPAKTAEDNLHPSWAAKQKLKPTITAFQGKKITFDDD